VNYTTELAQRMMVLMAALSEKGGAFTKQEALQYIQSHRFLNIQPDDLKPYETHTEPKWHTDIAWARQKCVDLEWMFRSDDNDYWTLTRMGEEKFKAFAAKFQSKQWDVGRCSLWSTLFQKKMCQTYEPKDSNDLNEFV
jgi:hypothetical protein